MSENLSAFLYLVASVCFILSLRGLSSPESARTGNILGMVGMAIAIFTTLASPAVLSYTTIIVGILIGGAIGTVIALKIQMTALPQLVAAFHSLVGLAAVFVAGAALYSPGAYGIGTAGNIGAASLIEMGLGVAIGAITFTGSLVAFGKLQGIVSGTPVRFPGQHMLNLCIGIGIVVFAIILVATESHTAFWILVALALVLGITLIIPIGGADMPVCNRDLPPPESLQIEQPGMSADFHAFFRRKRNRFAHHAGITRMKAAGDVCRCHIVQNLFIQPDFISTETLS